MYLSRIESEFIHYGATGWTHDSAPHGARWETDNGHGFQRYFRTLAIAKVYGYLREHLTRI